MLKKIGKLFLFLFLLFDVVYADTLNIVSEKYILYNLNENKILVEKDAHIKTNIASLTKIMTIIVSIENIEDYSEEITIELIRPMYLIKENDIVSWCRYNNLEFINCACKFTKKADIDENSSKRKAMKRLIDELRKERKNIDYNIFKSLENINLNNVLGYKKEGKLTTFLDEYDEN